MKKLGAAMRHEESYCLFIDTEPSSPSYSGDRVISRKLAIPACSKVGGAYLGIRRKGWFYIAVDFLRGLCTSACGYRINAEAKRHITALQGADTLVICNERIARAVLDLNPDAGRIIVLWHNLPSNVERSGHGLATLVLFIVAYLYERDLFRRKITSHLFISKLERDIAASVYGVSTNLITVGLPDRQVSYRPIVLNEGVLTGSYSWKHKRASLRRSIDGIRESGLSALFCNDELSVALAGSGIPTRDLAYAEFDAIRFAFITDDFFSGFKMKCLEYISMNCIIISAVDINVEFKDIPHAELFIRYDKNLANVKNIINYFLNIEDQKISQWYLEFKNSINHQFSWPAAVDSLASISR